MISEKTMVEIQALGIKIDHDSSFDGASTGNQHLFRVSRIIKYLVQETGARDDIATAAGWLHDTALPTGDDYDPNKNLVVIQNLLKNIDMSEEDRKAVSVCVATHEGTGLRLSLEAKIIHDADVLEKVGMLGVIRHTWKLTNFSKMNSSTITVENAQEVLDHIDWRIAQLELPEAQYLASTLSIDVSLERALLLIRAISPLASRGVITERIAEEIQPLLTDEESEALSLQLSQEYLD